MNDPNLVPTSRSTDLATYTVVVGTDRLPETWHVVSIDTTHSINHIPSARLVLLDGDTASATFEVSSADLLVPGAEITITAGYHSDEVTIFSGLVVRHGISSRNGRPGRLTIEARHRAVTMSVGRNSATYREVSDSEILEEMITAHGIEKTVTATTVQHAQMVQYRCSDWDFLVSRAEANGLLVAPGIEDIRVAPPELGSEPVLNLAWGSSILEIEFEMDAREQLASIGGSAWDPTTQEAVNVQAAEPDLIPQGDIAATEIGASVSPTEFSISHVGHRPQEELQAWADGRLLRQRLAKIRGRLKCQGTAAVALGEFVDLTGVGGRFAGPAFVAGIRHEIVNDNWITDLEFGLDPTLHSSRYEVEEDTAAGLLPGMQGLQPGVVVGLAGDPVGSGRVKVRLPLVAGGDDGVWARIASLDAGDSRGFVFRPEVGDEVVLGFFAGDPRDPVVLGMLHSSKNPPPIEASDDNHEKGLVTRDGLSVLFNDDDRSVAISTPGGNRLLMSEQESAVIIEDENGNKIAMSADGIEITSVGALSLTAASEITVEGSEVGVAAQGSFKAEGTAGAELTTTGTAIVKGALVQIN